MRNKKDKQKKSLIFSTAVVITGCIATAVYVNQSMSTAMDYKIDLSQMETDEVTENSSINDPNLGSGASLARVSGQDVVNTYPADETDKPAEEKTTEKTEKSAENTTVGQEPVDENPITEEKEDQKQETGEQKIKEKETSEDESMETASKSVVAPAADLAFAPEEGLGWPLAGDVILNYSMDSAVYFATLMQYKYNPAILIDAKEGDNVSACARGQVVAIGESSEQGRYVVMNLGNGYEVTYGQLENLQVKEGDMVSRGQVIANVAKTTKYYALEGDHVSLKVTKDGETVDPLSLLE